MFKETIALRVIIEYRILWNAKTEYIKVKLGCFLGGDWEY